MPSGPRWPRLGWQSMHIPEEYGGAGFSFLELGIVLEEMGRAVTPGPFFSSVVLGAGALLIGGSEQQKKDLLPGIASGETIATVAVVEPSGRWDADGVEMAAKRGRGHRHAIWHEVLRSGWPRRRPFDRCREECIRVGRSLRRRCGPAWSRETSASRPWT